MEKLFTRSRKSRLLLGTLWVFFIFVFALSAAAWLGMKASTISGELKAAARLAPQLKNEVLRDDAAAAQKTVDELAMHTAGARAAAGDPIWIAAGALPVLGINFAVTSEIATTADDVARLGAIPLVSTFKALNWASLAPSGQQVDISGLADAQPKLVAAADAVRQSSSRLNEIDSQKLVPQISKPLEETREQLTDLRRGLDTAADVATLLPPMLGDDAPRRYLLLVQNNAEVRASGGIPGALGVLTVDDGKLTLSEQTSAAELGTMTPLVTVDPEQEQLYSTRLGKYMQDVNLTPHFPTAASTAIAMWQQKNSDRLDGVLAIDPIALSYLLAATGPVELPDSARPAESNLPDRLSSSNVVKTLLSDVYAAIPDPALQDIYFANVASKVFEALSAGESEPKRLLDGLRQAASEGRILLWSDTSNEQELIEKYRLSGATSGPSLAPAQFGAYFNDGTGAKMDFYMNRRVQLLKECPADGYSKVRLRITSTNTAPKDAASSLSSYVTGGGTFGVPAGTVQTNLVAYGPVQSHLDTAAVEGRKVGFSSQRHGDRPVGTVTVRLAPGESTTVDFTFENIVQNSQPQLSVTPTVQPYEDVVLDTVSGECDPVR